MINSKLTAEKAVEAYNGRGDVENPDQRGERHTALGQDQLPPIRCGQARLLMGVLAYNLLNTLRLF